MWPGTEISRWASCPTGDGVRSRGGQGTVPDAGHSANAPGNTSALVEATDRFRGH